MSGPPGQRFIPQVPFGLGLGPQGQLAANLPPPLQTQPSPQPPIPGYVRRSAPGADYGRRNGSVISTRWAAPPPFLAPTGTFVGLGPAERIRRRRFLYQTITAPPVLATTFIAPPATIVSNHLLRRRGRSVPPSTLLPPAVVFVPPVARYANFIGLGVLARPKRLRNVYGTILPPPIAGQPVVPKGTFTSQAVGRTYTRRTVPTPHLAAPVPFFLAPRAIIVGQAAQRPLTRRGGAVAQTHWLTNLPVKPGAFIGQAVQRPLTRRTIPRPHLAAPVSATTFVAPRGTFLSQAVERSTLRRSGAVRLPALGSPKPVSPGVFLAQAVDRALTRRTIPAPHLARAVTPKTFVAPPATVVTEQAVGRALTRRSVPAPHLPKLGTAQPVTEGTFASQAIQRSLTRRTTAPRPHLATPIVAAAVPFRSQGFYSFQALQRAQSRRYRDVPPEPHLASPIATPAGPGATIKLQSLARQLRRREGQILLPRLGSGTPVPRGTFLSQALRRPYVSRAAPEPHLAPAVVSQAAVFLAPRALIVSQATKRAILRRSGSVNLPRRAGNRPVLAGKFNYQTIQRAQRRSVSKQLRNGPQLPVPSGPPSATYGTYVYQAVGRPYTRRQIFPTRVAGPIVTPAGPPPALAALWASLSVWHLTGPDRRYFRVQKPRLAGPVLAPRVFVAPPALIVSQVTKRAVLRRSGSVRLPSRGATPPVPRGTFLSQSLRRPYVGRTTPGPHLATPVVTRPAAFLAPAPKVVSQAVARAVLRRSGFVHLSARGSAAPVPTGTFVSQAVRRPLLGRGPFPKPHLAPPLVATVPFLAPPALIVGQASERGWQTRLRAAPRPHLASPVPFPQGPGATLRLQAVVGRALLGRGGRVRLPSLGAQPPVPRGTFLRQALQRPLRGRTVPPAHLAPEIVTQPTFPPNAPGMFVGQAVERSASLLSRRGHVRLAPPVLTQGRTPPTLIVSQALRRPYIGRKVIPPHLARPVQTKAGPGAHLYLQAVQRVLTRRTLPLHPKYARPLVKPPPAPISAFPIVFLQAVERMYIGRKVPPSPSLRYHPITFVPSQPPVPFFGITTTGVTGPAPRSGRTRPSPTTGVTTPERRTGVTDPGQQTGVTNPTPKTGEVSD